MGKGQTLRIKLKSFDNRLLDKSTRGLVDIAVKNRIKISGPVPLPVKVSKYIVNRSPHKDKKSREQFGLKIHKRMILLLNFDSNLVQIFMNSSLPAGVEVEVLIV
ncbi:MAG: 30S ribosomal protein S10 [Rickettsiaceae bacterium H1]|nr:30S ribosomal protein S10 [Rickettsiaceae bacterium H1]